MAGMYPENKEITVFGKTVKFPGVNAEGKFTNGDFKNPDVPPSYLDAETINLIIDNLNSLISHLGNSADNKNTDQLSRLFTVAAEAEKAVKRDSSGRAKVAAPSEEDDIARKKEIDDIVNGIVEFKKLTVLGDIIQKGSNKVTHTEDVYTKNDKIHLREGAVAALAEGELAGLVATLYDGKTNGVLGFDRNGTARVGDTDDTQPLATRAEESDMQHGAFAVWNAVTKRFETQGGTLVSVTASCNTGSIGYDKTIVIKASAPCILELGEGAYTGVQVKIINSTQHDHAVRGTTARGEDSTLKAGQIQSIIWNGSAWEGLSCPRIDEVYVQFPQQSAPQDLYICTKWTEISYDGAFFRASGGNAEAFIEKSGVLSMQESQNKEHSHGMDSAGNHKHGRGNMEITGSISGLGVTMGASGACYISSAYAGANPRVTSDSDARTITFAASRTWTGNTSENGSHSHTVHNDGGNEARPSNFTIRVWKRIA